MNGKTTLVRSILSSMILLGLLGMQPPQRTLAARDHARPSGLSYPLQAGTHATSSCRVYVDAAASGGDGTSWATAYKNLQDGINAANIARGGGENTCDVWVRAGSYSPKNSGDLFWWEDFVNIYGGFTGTETDISQRNWRTHASILQGNNYTVLQANFVYHTSLDGFTITGGDLAQRGGGIYVNCGAPFLTNLIIRNNNASIGGGIFDYNFGCSYPGYAAILWDVIISGNTASTQGGGIYFGGGNPSLLNVAFYENSAPQGDGIYNYNSIPGLINVSMSGDGIYNFNSNLSIGNSIIWEWGLSVGVVNEGSSRIPTISYSLVDGCNPGGTWNNACGTDGTHNLPDADPKFVAELPADLHLQGNSPAINKGDSSLISGLWTIDLDGNPRIVGSAVDLGAYEFQSTQWHIYLPLVVR